jgi:hypothetical protein
LYFYPITRFNLLIMKKTDIHLFKIQKKLNGKHYLLQSLISLFFWLSSILVFIWMLGIDFKVLFTEKEYTVDSVVIGFQIVLPLFFFVLSILLFLAATYRRLFTLIYRQKYLWVYPVGIAFGLIIYFSATEFFKYFLLITLLSLILF